MNDPIKNDEAKNKYEQQIMRHNCRYLFGKALETPMQCNRLSNVLDTAESSLHQSAQKQITRCLLKPLIAHCIKQPNKNRRPGRESTHRGLTAQRDPKLALRAMAVTPRQNCALTSAHARAPGWPHRPTGSAFCSTSG